MNLKDVGEFGFIEGFARKYDHLINESDSGIGDDCAILSINETENHVVTADLLIEDVHFLKDKITAKELGHKALAVNLSDIAAMGAKALYSFLSIGIPPNTPMEYLEEFMESYYQLSNKYQCPLMGGDTTKSVDKLVINVTVVGRVLKIDTHLRSMAENGDLVCVTGNLGDSAGGLKVLLENLEQNPDNMNLVKYHHMPEPQLHEAQFLAPYSGVHAMMDISDGIASDLKHILKASGKSANIHLDKIPCSDLLKDVSAKYDWDLYDLISAGGEDYQLLFTVKQDTFKAINDAFMNQFGKPIYSIGEILDGKEEIQWLENGKPYNKQGNGFDHFK